MIITISGPSSTGKTTLFEKLKKNESLIQSIYGGDVVFVEELVRSTIKDNYGDNTSFEDIVQRDDDAIKLQLMISDKIRSYYEEMIYNKDRLYICDRCPLDNVAYNLLNYQCNNPKVMLKYSQKLSDACSMMRALTSYVDRIYLTSVDRENEKSVERDGFRPTSYEYRRQLEIELFNVIFDFNPKVVMLPSVSNDRINVIITDLARLFNKK